MPYIRNEMLGNDMLPVDIVLGPAWWFKHEGITFDEDYFFHPARRVEVERAMERALHQRWGHYGLGSDYQQDLPVIGPIHLAAGFLISEMLGCRVNYAEDKPPIQILVNGQTGRVGGKVPVSAIKVSAAVLVALVVIGLFILILMASQ